jgi:hypothetical protein
VVVVAGALQVNETRVKLLYTGAQFESVIVKLPTLLAQFSVKTQTVAEPPLEEQLLTLP